MRLQKQAYMNRKREEDIKRLKLKGYSNYDIAKELGITERRVNDILQTSLKASKLQLDNHNKKQKAAGLPLFDVAKVSTDFSSLSKLGEAVKEFQKTAE